MLANRTAKWRVYKCEYNELAEKKETLQTKNEALKKENEALKEECQTQKSTITALRSELENKEAVKGIEGQLNSKGDNTEVKANTQNSNSEVRELERSKDRFEKSTFLCSLRTD